MRIRPARPRGRDLKLAALRASALGRDWPEQALRALARDADLIDVPPGYPLVHAGERLVAAFLLVHGALAESRDDEAWMVTAPGSIIGAAETIASAAAASSVTALEPTSVLAIPARALLGGVDRSRRLRAATLAELARRALPTARRGNGRDRDLDPADA